MELFRKAFNIKKLLRWIIVFLLTILIIFVSPVIILCVSLILVFRFLAAKYAQAFRPDLGKILTTRSAIFATDDLYGKPKSNVLFIVTCRSGMVTADFKRDFIRYAINAKCPGTDQPANPEFRQHLTSFMGFPFWKWDANFSIDDHVKDYDGSIPVDVLTQKHLDGLCTHYLKTPFKRGQSPWEMIFFPKCKLQSADSDEPRIAGLLRLSHCVADGFSIMKFTSSLIPEQTLKYKVPTPPKLSTWENILFVIKYATVGPFEFVNGLIDAWDVNECHVSEKKLSPDIKLAFSERIPMSYIKEIKKIHGTGFTPVLLAAFTGAIRSFMIENGFKIPDLIHSVTPFPMTHRSEKLRNYMTTCFIRLPIGLPTAEERLLAIDKNVTNLKKSTQPLTMFYILALIGSLPSVLARIFFKQYCPTALISNFPGPNEVFSYLGQPCEDIMFTAGLLPGRIGIGFSAISYNGSLRIQAAFNEGIGKSDIPWNYMLDKVLDELHILARHNV